MSVDYAAGGTERYLVPLAVHADLPSDRGRHAPLARRLALRDPGLPTVASEPEDGDGAWSAIVDLIRRDAELRGRRGSFRFTSTPALHAGAGADAPRTRERRLGGEQSNTSVAVDEALLLKCYRRLDDGLNPEIEILAFLAAHGFGRTPALLGSGVYVPDAGEPSAIAILQEYVPNAQDAWRYTLERLERWIGAGAGDDELETLGDSPAEIGIVTAELHAALAAEPGPGAFESRLATREEASLWLASAEEQFHSTVAAVPSRLATELRELTPQVVRALAPLGDAATATVMRTHGDYHLGQLLRRGDTFLVIDFEGEPARPLAERRRPQSPLRDVAGMLRSFSYAAGAVSRADAERATPVAEEAVARWLALARSRFVHAYEGAVARAGVPLAMDTLLLRAFEVEKACYEIRYEASNRPDWVRLPMAGLRSLLDA